MGIRDLLAAHDARFISVSELLAAVAEAENVTTQEAARAFILQGLLSAPPHRLRDHADGEYRDASGAAAYHEVEAATDSRRSPWTSVSVEAESEFNIGEPGFFRDEIAAALASCGFVIPDCLTWRAPAKTPNPVPKLDPSLLAYVPRMEITISEATSLLTMANGEGPWWAALEDAADSGRIQSGSWSGYRGDQQLSHADIRAWCEAAGAVWPVPLPPGAEPTTDHSLREALAESRDEADRLRAEITHLKSELGALQAKNAGSNDTADSDPSVTQAPRTEVSVNLPHMTRGLESLFCVMREQWSHYSPDNPPKSSVVADALDSAMGWNAQKSGEASRNAQALASLIRPDEIADADPRNARRR